MEKLSSIIARIKAPTPAFFKKVRLIGLALIAMGFILLGIHSTLPDIATRIGGYLVTTGCTISGVSQTTVEDWWKIPEDRETDS
ncbi:hypothetical protein SAMN05421788_10399 [Filimonas lacunae]|uniref:Uncharacterized protein n=1 Tax=Filimonas lacunae TaxID=477680 RepID=A0A173MJU8_9BACT|nr:hypothetical protein [Filimonas lacunae]BAV07749.1 hypothetical protein FLA_3780 [Filimonas lacunae]SIT04347.1 hypothetical protein SAMN05421788_10399 [Filimonas lacunae]